MPRQKVDEETRAFIKVAARAGMSAPEIARRLEEAGRPLHLNTVKAWAKRLRGEPTGPPWDVTQASQEDAEAVLAVLGAFAQRFRRIPRLTQAEGDAVARFRRAIPPEKLDHLRVASFALDYVQADDAQRDAYHFFLAMRPWESLEAAKSWQLFTQEYEAAGLPAGVHTMVMVWFIQYAMKQGPVYLVENPEATKTEGNDEG